MLKKIAATGKSLFIKHLLSRTPKYTLNYKGKGQINLIDVGSVGGLPTPWRANANKIKFLLNFDPNEPTKKGKHFMTYGTALWEKAQTKTLYIYKGFNHTGSSLFLQNFAYVDKHYAELKQKGSPELAASWHKRSELLRKTPLKCEPLDHILTKEFPQSRFDFLKIDAQGAELNILKGAETFLKTDCLGLHLELFTIPLYKGIALRETVEKYLSDLNFELVKVYPPHGTFHSQNDCLFLKKKHHPKLDLIREIYKIAPTPHQG